MTGYENDHDYNSLWTVKEGDLLGADGHQEALPCRTGTIIKCGDIVRFEHMNTGRNLHSHARFDSPVSGRQEVSAFGDNGDGDGGT